jgi:saccharopine dehydrogenase (NAD+, L-lysine-forming)
MKVLLVGVGGVGEAIAVIAKDRSWVEKLVLSDYNLDRAKEVQAKVGLSDRMPVERIDAGDRGMIAELARKHGVDLIMNAVDPVFNEAIFDAAYEVGCNYMDMAMTLSTPHPSDPFNACGVKLGDYQFERAGAWEKKGLLALVGMGVEPGMADVFAKYAEKHLFDEIEEIGIRDGANLEVRGYDFAPNFSIWTTIEECLNPPVIWEEGKGWWTTEPFSEPETFEFPEGIGPVECVNVEHEEVLLVPRWVKCKRVTFKYGLGDEFISVLKTIKMLGLDNRFPIDVKGVKWPHGMWWPPRFPTPRISAIRCSARPAPEPGSRE